MLRRIVSGFKDTDLNTQLSERGIVVVGGIPVGFGVGGGGCWAATFPDESTKKLGSAEPTKLARNKLAT
jgi:hypothetical protein